MKEKINSYFAVLLVTIAGSIATLIIVHVAYDTNTLLFIGSEGAYVSTQQSILNP